MQRRGAQAILVIAEIGVGQVPFQDLVLAQLRFKPEGDQHFARLAGKRLFGGKESKLGQLLGDGGTATHPRPRRAGDAARVHAPVIVEPPVFDREKGLDHVIGQLLHVHRQAHHGPVAGNRRAVTGQQGDGRRDNGFKRFRQRRSDREVGDQQEERHQRSRKSAHCPPQLVALRLADRWRGQHVAGRKVRRTGWRNRRYGAASRILRMPRRIVQHRADLARRPVPASVRPL